MQISKAYSEWSETYDSDRNLTRDLDQAVVKKYLAGSSFKRALEIGCGTGKNTPVLANVAEQVVALDFSPGMIAKAKAKLSLPNVNFQITDINNDWPCAEASFDLISCNLMLEHVENLSHIFQEASRVLMPGGQFFVCELHPCRQYQGTQARFEGGEGTTMIEAFVHHISDFTDAATANGLSVLELKEWWHEEDQGKPPRLISFTFLKPALSQKT